MKIGWLVCVFVVVGLSSTTIAQAQKIVIIDTQRVITESIIGKAAKNNLEVEIKKGQAKVAALKADFDKTVKDANNPMLNESGKKAAVGEAQAKQQNLQQRFNEYQQFVQQAQASIQARAGELEKAVLADVKTAAEKVAKEKGLQLILPKAVAFVADDSLNVTADIVKELNDSYKSAAPAPAAPAGDKPAAK